LAALLIPGAAILVRLTRLTVQFSNRCFVIYVPLIVIVITAVIIVVAGSGCATITIIEVAAVLRTRGAIRFFLIAVVFIEIQIA
jgi:hypothetical protein